MHGIMCSQEEDSNSNMAIREGCMKEVVLVLDGYVGTSGGPPLQEKQVIREKGDSTKPKVQEKQRNAVYFKANYRHHFTNKIFSIISNR